MRAYKLAATITAVAAMIGLVCLPVLSIQFFGVAKPKLIATALMQAWSWWK